MADYYIPAGQMRIYGLGTFPNNATLDDLHNVVGNVTYQIGVAPPVVMPFHVNQDPVVLPVNGQQFQVTNNLPSELKVSG